MEYAYHFDDLEVNHVLGELGYPGICNLDNAIHPMWRRERFRVGSIRKQVRMLKINDGSWDRSTFLPDQRIYQRMEPGLRLASLLLEQSGPFFSRLMYGQLQTPPIKKLHPRGGPDEWRIRSVNVVGDPRYPPQVVAAQLKAFAEHVAENSLIYIPNDIAITEAWGELHTTFQERCRYAIGIGSILSDVICQPQWHRISAQTRRYYNFQLAATLVHELAHVAWRCRRWDDLLQDPGAEPEEAVLSPSEEQIELGQSWEKWFFGGELCPIDTFEVPARWLGFSFSPFTIDTENQESMAYKDCRSVNHAIPAFCINQFFQKERWAAHKDGSDPFSIRLTPLNSLTNEIWEGDHDDGFMYRMKLNQESQTDPRPSFPEE